MTEVCSIQYRKFMNEHDVIGVLGVVFATGWLLRQSIESFKEIRRLIKLQVDYGITRLEIVKWNEYWSAVFLFSIGFAFLFALIFLGRGGGEWVKYACGLAGILLGWFFGGHYTEKSLSKEIGKYREESAALLWNAELRQLISIQREEIGNLKTTQKEDCNTKP